MVFSIIIPTYNSSLTLKTCLESIIRQTYNNYEILIIDGLSNDNTLEIAKSFNDPRIKIFSEKDEGIYDAMNKGIRLAKGEWLYFLGSDDSLFDNRVLSDISDFIRSRTRSFIVYGNVKIVGNAGWASDGQTYDGKFCLNKILQKNISHQSIFYPKNVLKNTLYNLEYKVCADYDLNLKLFSKHDFKYIDRIISNFAGGGYSLSSKDDKFCITNCVVKYYFYSLWKKEFYPLRNGFRNYRGNNVTSLGKFYLFFVYLKHRLIKY